MTAAERWCLVSEASYLEEELVSEGKHEFIAGVVYAMAGGRNRHNVISGSAFAHLHARLRGKPCRPFNSDTKVRIRLNDEVRYYYPDAMVVCERNPEEDTFQERPVVIVEVISNSTRRIDEDEKKRAYLSIPNLETYLLVEQEAPVVVAFHRRQEGFDRVIYQGVDAVIPLAEIEIELPLAEIFEDVAF